MDKYEKLSNIKEYISKIEEDVLSSCKKEYCDKDTLMTKNILECLKAVSGLLEDIVSEKNPTSNNRFFITEEQQDELRIISNATVTNIANEINRVTENNNTSKITSTWITDWLISVNILEINNSGERIPTKTGKDMGITSKLMQVSYNRMQNINYYPKEMQMFIYDNIESIINFHYNCKPKTAEKKSRNQFFITDEQRSQLQILKNAKISDIVDELNKFMQKNNTQKIQTKWITDWLVDTGIFERNDMGKGIPTTTANEIGIYRELIKKEDGSAYFQIWYSDKAQKFIYDNIDNIIAFYYNKN